jgi:hypothetical protein
MKIGGHPTDVMVDMDTKDSVVTQPMGPLSNNHTTITGATWDQAYCPFLMARQYSLESHEVRHELLCLPDFLVGLLGRDLLYKLRAQITFDSDGTAALNLGRLKAKTNPHSCTRRMSALCP